MGASENRAQVAIASPSQRAEIIELLSQQLREHGIATSRAAITAAVDGMLEHSSRGFVLTATAELGVVGVAYVSFVWALEHGGKSAWLEELYVLPAQREVGIGTALLAEVLDRARDCGCACVDLEVDVEHARAENLYRRAGFTPLPRARWVRRLQR